MKGNRTKKKLINKFLPLSLSLVLFVVSIITLISVIDFSSKSADVDFNPTTNIYSNVQTQIKNPNTSSVSDETITMSEAIQDSSSIENKTITIGTSEELYLFSAACNGSSASLFLTKNYKLISNIEYSEFEQEFIPVGYKGTAFSGVFDGNNYEISNLKMVQITANSNNASEFATMYYYAMFSVNAGTIKNLGLVEFRNTTVSIELDNVVNEGGVANLVGHNEAGATVEYCYYRDLREMIDDEIGIAFYGGYRIAGLVYLNDGSFTNSYVAVSTVVNHKISGYESISSICYEDNNYSENSNLYYYDGSIDTYRIIGNAKEITYVDEVFNDSTFLGSNHDVGIYCSELNGETGFNSNYLSTTGVGAKWFIPQKYDETLAGYIKNPTPILRGLSYTKNQDKYTFNINDVDDFLYMFELMNAASYFAEDKVIYQINADINLKNIDSKNYYYSQIMTCTITSNKNGGTVCPTLIDTTVSAYPTIYNFNCIDSSRKTTTLGIDAYGLFPYLGGTISYLNIVPYAFDMKDVEESSNVKGIAAVSGYVEKGTISNVNVYITSTHTQTDIKEYYLGGICGILGGEGTIDNCTSAGSFTFSRFTSDTIDASLYTQGDAIGGIVGYICDTYGSIKTCTSAIDIDFNANSTNVNYQIGGIAGAAYTIEADELEYVGSINIGSGTETSGGTDGSRVQYNKLYVAGIIGRHLGVKEQIKNFTNQGDIKVFAYPTNNELYIAGIENADILTTTLSTGLIPSSDKSKDGNFRFRASSMTNRADIITGSSNTSSVVEITSGINVFAKNGFVSELSGVYNLNYKEVYNSSTTKEKQTLGAYQIYINNLYKYANVINVLNGTTPNANYTTNLTTVYNLRDTNITTYSALSGNLTFEYYGTVKGKYINYYDVRNEGKITATTSNNIGADSNTVNVILAGVMEEVSEKCSADNIFNGGDISFTYSNSNINGNVIASGICYKNSGYDSSTIDKYNPSSNSFDSKAKGAMNNVINNGAITIDNPTGFQNVSYDYSDIIKSANGQSNLGTKPKTTYSSGYYIKDDIFASGIVAYNEATITNTFNLGDIFVANYIKNTTEEKEINVAGIATLNIGKYAYILNSANNGTLKGINLSSGTEILSNVNVAGIIARNDELADGTDYASNTTNPNSSQIVSFAINYGNIYAYNYAENIQSTAYVPKAKASGIVAMGLLNTINVLNYGNIYGSETSSGIFGVMYFSKFADEVTSSSKVYIANTINYGNVYMLSRGYNYVHGNTYLDYTGISYSRFKAITETGSSAIVTENAMKGNIEAFTSIERNTFYRSIIGSVFAIANYNLDSKAENIAIRYLISFNENAPIVGETVSAPSTVSVVTNTLYSAHVEMNAATGAYVNDKWINNYVEYAPLSTSSVSGSFVTNINATTGAITTANKSYYGIFNTNFPFTQAILGKTTLDVTTNPTDQYLTDYFQFVGFQYINPILFEKIGWQSFAYKSAANDFATNVDNVIKVLNKSSNYISSVSSAAKSAFEWMQYSTADDLNSLIDELAKDERYEDIDSVLKYIFSNESQSNIYITKELRQSIVNYLVENDSDLIGLINSMLQYENGYSTVLAEAIVTKEDEIKEYVESYIDGLSASSAADLLDSYINYLENNSNDYFSYGSNETGRINLLTTLLENVNDSTFYTEMLSILGIDANSISDSAKMLSGYNSLTTAQRKTLFETIITYNLNNIDTYLNDMSSDIGFYSELVKDGYSLTSMNELYSRADLNSNSTASSTDIINERIRLWNLIKDTSIFKSRFSTSNDYNIGTLYFKATEYNNTYQSITEPHNDGAYLGDTSERLSYYYTTNITPAVYFYGPYTNSNGNFSLPDGKTLSNTNNSSISGNSISGYSSIFHADSTTLYSSTAYIKGRGGANSTITFRNALRSNILMYYDLDNEQLGQAGTSRTINNTTFNGFYYELLQPSISYVDPMNGGTYSGSDWSGIQFGPTTATMTVSSTGETFSLNNAKMTGIYYSGSGRRTLSNGNSVTVPDLRMYIQDEYGAWHPIYGNISFNGASLNFSMQYNSYDRVYNIYSYLAYLYGKKYYTSAVNKYWHSTARTGIYRFAQPWGSHSQYFTWKQSQSNKVYTSQYIDYSKSDLLNLDGVLTEYDQKTYSEDERFIINYIFNNYLLTSSNITKFRRLIQASLLEVLGDNETNGTSFIDNFFMTNIYSSTRSALSNQTPFVYLYQSSGTTVQKYLLDRQTITSNNKNLLINGLAANQSKYVNFIKRLKEMAETTNYSDYAGAQTLYNYLKSNPSVVSNDIIQMSNFSSSSLADLISYFALFDDGTDVAINTLYDLFGKMSAYSGVVTKNQATYSSDTYEYGFKFNSMTLTPQLTDTRVIIIAKSTGTSSVLTSGSQSVTVSGINEYYFKTNGSTSFTITSDLDVVVYNIYFIQDATLDATLPVDGVVNDTNPIGDDASKHESYFTVSKSEIEQTINASWVYALGEGTYFNLNSYTVTANVTVTSSSGNPKVMYFAPASSVTSVDSNTEFTCAANTTTTTSFTITDDMFDKPIYAVQSDDGGATYKYNYWRYISSVNYTVSMNVTSEKEYKNISKNIETTHSYPNANTAQTFITLSEVQRVVESDSGSQWNSSTMSINSVTAYVTVNNTENRSRNIGLRDSNNTKWIANSTGVSAGSNHTFAVDVTKYYGTQFRAKRDSNNNNTYYNITEIYYVINYSMNGYFDVIPNKEISNETIYKNRLLNLNLKQSTVQNKYMASIFDATTNASTKYNAFARDVLTNFAPINVSGNDANPINLFVNSLSTDANKIAFAKKVIENSNIALYHVIKELCSTNAEFANVLKMMAAANNGNMFIADAIIKLASTNYTDTSTSLIDYYSDVLKTLVATYLVANYRSVVSVDDSLYDTVYRTLVDNVSANASGSTYNNKIDYINSDGSIDATKYDLFVEYILGESQATTSYGIFALASSRGIQNGSFIPDNVNLASMDAKYNTTSKLNDVSYISITDELNRSWRDNLGSSTAYDTTNENSVNYKVIVEMKQLLKAISNVIFDLDLKCDDTILYSSEEQIDYENKEIIYYVSENYLNYIKSASDLQIEYLLYADTATCQLQTGDYIALNKEYKYEQITLTESTFVSGKYYTNNAGTYTLATAYVSGARYYDLVEIDAIEAITIVPEERAYTAKYKLRFIKINNTISTFTFASMYYKNSEDSNEYTNTTNAINIPYYGARITFNVTVSNLPNGMDLKSFFKINGQIENDTWEFNPDALNNGIVNANSATIVVDVFANMPKGAKAFVLNLYGSSKQVSLTKNANANALITSFEYEGNNYTTVMNSSKSASSTILFGRAFDYDELTKPYVLTTDTVVSDLVTYYVQNGSNDSYSYSRVLNPIDSELSTYYVLNDSFYLYSFGISSNATVKITAEKEEDSSTGLMTYTVIYDVKSESGTTVQYKHYLTENDYFIDGQAYATLYKEGVNIGEDIYTKDFMYGTTEILGEYSDLIYDSTESNYVAVIFNRGDKPQYRIRYNLSRFYGDITKYTVTQGENNPSETSPQDTYAGITITVDDENEPGIYKYNYVYTNTGMWTAQGTYVHVGEDDTYDASITYYEYENGQFVDRNITSARMFNRNKDDLYIYQLGEGGLYTRTYSFPALYVYKDFATDALFHKLTFLDESVVLGGTASVMLPTTPISAGSANTDSDAINYSDVFAIGADNPITINPNSIDYKDSAKAVSVTDYYTVGTVSDTDLENYAPTIKTEDNAQVFKYTTITKLTKYGEDNGQATGNNGQPYKDSDILTVRDDMLLYVPFVSGTGENAFYKEFLVLLDENMNWLKVYDPEKYKGVDDDGTLTIKTYSGNFTTKDAEDTPSITGFSYKYEDPKTKQEVTGDFVIAPFAGSTVVSGSNSNISLYMDYIGTPLEDHFWYISYVVFSEYFFNKGITDKNNDGKDDLGAIRYYHISIVDASNNVYFDVSLYAPDNFKLDSIYLTFSDKIYKSANDIEARQLSCYLEKERDENNNLIYGASGTDEAGLVLYRLNLSMAALPAGYMSFFIDLPNGYGAICYTNKDNELNTSPYASQNPDTYVPHTTIIPITIGLKIIVAELTGESSTVWAVNTSDLYTRKITYSGKKEF